MNWYILFVTTNYEWKVIEVLKKCLDPELYYPFIIILETIFIKAGHAKKENNIMFPGYVFIESDVNETDFVKAINSASQYSLAIYRYLKNGDNGGIAMNDNDRSILYRLCNNDHVIKGSKGIMVGDDIYINDGPLKGREGIIKKVDRHKRRAYIELEVMGGQGHAYVTLEIVEKIPAVKVTDTNTNKEK